MSEGTAGTSPEVDVVILTRDRIDMTLATLESVLGQRDVRPSVRLVDQGSRPDALDALRQHAGRHEHVELIELGHNVGVPRGRNIGAAGGRAPLIVNIDNDAVFDGPAALRHVCDRMQRQPRLGAVAFRILNYTTRREESWSYPQSMRPMAHREFKAARFVGCGHAIRRSAFERAGGFDERLFFCEEELDLALKLLASGHEIVYDPGATVLHKVAPEARVRWDGGRFYYQTRNALYLDFKYYRSLGRTSLLGCGYLAKAFYNRVPAQALRGVADALRMARLDVREGRLGEPLPAPARRYVHEHEARFRGAASTRVRNEVLVKMRGLAR